MSKVNIMGIDIDSLTNQETINKVEEYIINKKPLHLMGVNADKLNLCKTDKKLEEIVKKSEINKLEKGQSVLQDTTALGMGAKHNCKILERKVR